jgi:hypothetical protein
MAILASILDRSYDSRAGIADSRAGIALALLDLTRALTGVFSEEEKCSRFRKMQER